MAPCQKERADEILSMRINDMTDYLVFLNFQIQLFCSLIWTPPPLTTNGQPASGEMQGRECEAASKLIMHILTLPGSPLLHSRAKELQGDEQS